MGRRGCRAAEQARNHRRRPRAHAVPSGSARTRRAAPRDFAPAAVGVALVVIVAIALAGMWVGGTTSADQLTGATQAKRPVPVVPSDASSALPAGEAQTIGPGAEKRIERAQRDAARREKAAEERAWRKAEPEGTYAVVPGRAKAPGDGTVVRYLVEVERGLPVEPAEFAARVHGILNDRAGWGKGGRTMRFVRVEDGPVRFRVSLSSPGLTDSQCAPLRTYGRVSCFNGTRTVLNSTRWRLGSPTYGMNLEGYRDYLVNHEVGHALGRDHVGCPEPKAPAPVMVQQTKSLEGCRANPWPYPERADR